MSNFRYDFKNLVLYGKPFFLPEDITVELKCIYIIDMHIIDDKKEDISSQIQICDFKSKCHLQNVFVISVHLPLEKPIKLEF